MEPFSRMKQVLRYRNSFKRYFSCSFPHSNNESIVTEDFKDVKVICINKPSKRNCLDVETFRRLLEELKKFDEDDQFKVAVLHGEGGNFSSGLDMDEIAEKGYGPILEVVGHLEAKSLCKKPIVASVCGYTVAEGLELALACDLRVIEDTASLGFLGRRFGAPMILGGGKRLSYLIGASRALDLTITGRLITGAQAHEWGLAARSVSTGTSLGQALNLAGSLIKFPVSGLLYDKQKIYESENTDEVERLRLAAIKEMDFNSARFQEGVGKHGSFKNLYIKEVSSWEIEDGLEQGKS